MLSPTSNPQEGDNRELLMLALSLIVDYNVGELRA